jgi:CheY-like chemotaxis protein
MFGSFAFRFETKMSKPSSCPHATKPRVLLIDDNRHGLLARRSVLEEQGCVVTTCDCPETALAQFADLQFDLIVTDFRMPQIDGTELIREIRQQRPNVPVVLISGMVDVLGLNEQNTGADAVVAKNAFEVSHMVRAVNRLLHRTATPKKPVRSQIGTHNLRAKSG